MRSVIGLAFVGVQLHALNAGRKALVAKGSATRLQKFVYFLGGGDVPNVEV